MKILFIYYDTGSSDFPRIGLGVAYLSAFLKKHGHHTKLCYFRSEKDIRYLISIIESWSPQIIAHLPLHLSFPSLKQLN